MNWISSILAVLIAVLTVVQIWWDYLLKYFSKDGRTNENKVLRKRLLIVVLVSFAANQLASIVISHENDIQSKADKRQLHDQTGELTNQLAMITAENLKLRDEINQGFQKIRSEFSTNAAVAPAVRLAVLDTVQEELFKERAELKKTHELFNTAAPDMKTLRAERENELALQENEKKQAAIHKDIQDIQLKKTAEEVVRIQQIQKQELLNCQKILASQILPVFNYLVGTLDTVLLNFSNESGEKRVSDFPGSTPNIYDSAMVKDGIMINGTNQISIGTNSAWSFRISTSVAPLRSIEIRPDLPLSFENYHAIHFKEPYVSLKVESQTTNGTSILTLTPYREWHPDFPSDPPAEGPPTSEKLFYIQLSVKLQTPNHLDLDEFAASTNYETAVAKAIRRLVEAQDQQRPLTSKPK